MNLSSLALALLFACTTAMAADKVKKEEAPKDKAKGKQMFAIFDTSMGTIKIKLFPEEAPKTVENFVSLAEGTVEWTNPKTGKTGKTPLYNGTIFHRVIKDFMIQGGDPAGNGTGGPKGKNWPFADEFNPKLKHSKPGVFSMANAGPGTNGSQFFITTIPTPWLDGKHTIFGEVVEGMDVVTKIENVKKAPGDKPLEDVVLKTVKIERK